MTTGELIRKYRKEKGLSQMDLCLKIGWENASTLSRIEKDEVKPNRETIQKIYEAMNLNLHDNNILLKSGGFLVVERVLDKSYLLEMQKYFSDTFDSLNYPVFVEATFKNIFYYNKASAEFFIGNINISKNILGLKLIEILNLSEYKIRENILNWDEFAKVIAHNYFAMFKMFGEKENLPDAFKIWFKEESFIDGWNEANKNQVHTVYSVPLIYKHTKYGVTKFDITITFHPNDQRFIIIKMIPMD